MNLFKTELFKINKGKNKYLLIIPFFITFLIASIPIVSKQNTIFFSNIMSFYSLGIYLIIPLGIGLFTISIICSDYSNKTIKYLITSEYSRPQIVFFKFLAISFYVSLIFLVFSLSIFIISFCFSDMTSLYINFVKINTLQLIIHLIKSHFFIWLFLIAVVSVAMTSGIVLKKLDIAILVYIFLILILSFLSYDISKYTFIIGVDSYKYIDSYGLYSDKFKQILSSLSCICLCLYISCLSLEKFEY